MEMYYGSKGVNNYIEINAGKKATGNDEKSFVYKMLENNSISGLIRPAVSMLDSNIYLRYPVNSYFVLEKYFIKSKPDIKSLEAVLTGICECIKSIEGYLLNPDNLVILPKYMLWDEKKGEIKMIYAPGCNNDVRLQLKCFMEYIMKVFDYKSPEGTMKMHGLYEIIIKDNFDINELEEYMNKKNQFNQSSYAEYINVQAERKQEYFPDVSPSAENDISDAVIIEGGEKYETVIKINALISAILFLLFLFMKKSGAVFVLFAASIIVLVINAFVYIIKNEKEEQEEADSAMYEFRQRTLERTDKKEYKLIPLNDGMLEPVIIDMNKDGMVIGRDKNESDYRLDKEQISRIHAKIIIKNNEIYIEDKNSTNGTFINSVRLKESDRLKINAGDIIKFANEEFFVA